MWSCMIQHVNTKRSVRNFVRIFFFYTLYKIYYSFFHKNFLFLFFNNEREFKNVPLKVFFLSLSYFIKNLCWFTLNFLVTGALFIKFYSKCDFAWFSTSILEENVRKLVRNFFFLHFIQNLQFDSNCPLLYYAILK